jgi:hypothetical protein
MSRPRVVVGIVLGSLFAASLVAWAVQPAAEEVARAECAARGWPADDLSRAGFSFSSGWLGFGQTRTVDFVRNADPLRRVRVTLQRATYFIPWRVVAFEELAGGA